MKNIDFSNECSIILIGENSKGKEVRAGYERSRFISDDELTKEAKLIFNDMKKRKVQDIKILKSIYIARNEEQYQKVVSDVAMC